MQRPALGARPPDPPEMTLEQWADRDEDDRGELVDGLLEEEEVPTFVHEAIVSWFLFVLKSWASPRGGWVFGSEAKYAVAPKRGRKPDLSVYLPGTPMPPGRAALGRVPPSIMIEIISSRPRDARRDRIDKRHEYASFGVTYYWIVEPRLRTLEIYEFRAEGAVVTFAASDGAHSIPGCADLVLDLDALWAEIAKLPDGGDDLDE